jgi:hypothetical protein
MPSLVQHGHQAFDDQIKADLARVDRGFGIVATCVVM